MRQALGLVIALVTLLAFGKLSLAQGGPTRQVNSDNVTPNCWQEVSPVNQLVPLASAEMPESRTLLIPGYA